MKPDHDTGPSYGVKNLHPRGWALTDAGSRNQALAVHRFSSLGTRTLRAGPTHPEVRPIRDNQTRVANHLFDQAVSGITVKVCVRATGAVRGWPSLPSVRPRPSFDSFQDPARSADRLRLLGTGSCSRSRVESEVEVRIFRSRR